MNKRLIAGVIAVATCGYVLWQFLTPVEISAVQGKNECSKMYDCHGDILLVKHFPYLKNRQIAWWEANKAMIQEKYGIPHKDDDGYYSVTIMDFGSGYRIDGETDQDSNLLCFDEMPVDARCVEKKPLLWIDWSQNTGLFYR
ncbi:DUF943 family protein [Serratia sp. NPDC078593]|uniref:DUF943 family protein n=1 Tax=unclassified Serratia (in: enterobacteria) TaxID=2647522 RepID=UPI0037CD6A29